MTTLDSTNPALAPLHDDLSARLGELADRLRRAQWASGLLRVASLAVALMLLSYVLDRALTLSVPLRLGYLALNAGVIAWFVRERLVRPLRTPLRPMDLAAALDRHHRGGVSLSENVATVLQLSQPDARHGASPVLIERAIRHSHLRLAKVDFAAHADGRGTLRRAALTLTVALLPVLLSILAPTLAGVWARRWIGLSDTPWPTRTRLTVPALRDGRIIVARGEPFSLRVLTQPGSVAPEWVRLRIQPGGRSATILRVPPTAAGDFRQEFTGVYETTTVHVRGGDDALPAFVIEPMDRPRITEIRLIARHAALPEPREVLFTGDTSDVSVLKGAQVELRLSTQTDLARASVATSAGLELPVQLADPRRVAAHWTHDAPRTLRVEVVAAASGLASPPLSLTVGLTPDRAPTVTLQSRGVGPRITPQATIPLTLAARDDFALTRTGWALSVDPAQGDDAAAEDHVGTPPPGVKEHRTDMELPLRQGPPLTAGTLVQITGWAEDDCLDGPQRGPSRPLIFRVVEPEELFRDILLRLQQVRIRLRKATDALQAVAQSLTTASHAPALAPEARRHREALNEVTRLTATLDASLTEMKLNALGGAEMHGLLERGVIEPLRSVATELLAPQRDTLDALTRQFDPARCAQAVPTQEEAVSRLREVLRQMGQWDSFVDVINQLDEVIRLQREARQRAEQLRSEQVEQLFEP